MYQLTAFFLSLYCSVALQAFGPLPAVPADSAPPAPLPPGVTREAVDALNERYGLETPAPTPPFQQIAEAFRNADWGWSIEPSA